MKKIFAANWKLFKGPKETREFFAQWNEGFSANDIEVVFFPSALSVEAAVTAASKATAARKYDLNFGVQNVYAQSQGAFTGKTPRL